MVKITSDVYNISNRIKNIDRNYFIVYNTSKRCFEVHNKQQKNTYCVTLPYKTLDERTLNYTLKTRSQNLSKILISIEQQNAEREKQAIRDTLNEVDDSINQLRKEKLYPNNTSRV